MEPLQRLEILVDQDDGRLLFLYSDLLFLQSLDRVDNAVGDHSVQNIDEVLLVGETLACDIREVELDQIPLLTPFTAVPDPLRRELFPIGQVLHPLHFGLCKQLLLATEDITAEVRGHVTKGWCVLLHVVVEEIHQSLPVWTLLGEL